MESSEYSHRAWFARFDADIAGRGLNFSGWSQDEVLQYLRGALKFYSRELEVILRKLKVDGRTLGSLKASHLRSRGQPSHVANEVETVIDALKSGGIGHADADPMIDYEAQLPRYKEMLVERTLQWGNIWEKGETQTPMMGRKRAVRQILKVQWMNYCLASDWKEDTDIDVPVFPVSLSAAGMGKSRLLKEWALVALTSPDVVVPFVYPEDPENPYNPLDILEIFDDLVEGKNQERLLANREQPLRRLCFLNEIVRALKRMNVAGVSFPTSSGGFSELEPEIAGNGAFRAAIVYSLHKKYAATSVKCGWQFYDVHELSWDSVVSIVVNPTLVPRDSALVGRLGSGSDLVKLWCDLDVQNTPQREPIDVGVSKLREFPCPPFEVKPVLLASFDDVHNIAFEFQPNTTTKDEDGSDKATTDKESSSTDELNRLHFEHWDGLHHLLGAIDPLLEPNAPMVILPVFAGMRIAEAPSVQSLDTDEYVALPIMLGNLNRPNYLVDAVKRNCHALIETVTQKDSRYSLWKIPHERTLVKIGRKETQRKQMAKGYSKLEMYGHGREHPNTCLRRQVTERLWTLFILSGGVPRLFTRLMYALEEYLKEEDRRKRDPELQWLPSQDIHTLAVDEMKRGYYLVEETMEEIGPTLSAFLALRGMIGLREDPLCRAFPEAVLDIAGRAKETEVGECEGVRNPKCTLLDVTEEGILFPSTDFIEDGAEEVDGLDLTDEWGTKGSGTSFSIPPIFLSYVEEREIDRILSDHPLPHRGSPVERRCHHLVPRFLPHMPEGDQTLVDTLWVSLWACYLVRVWSKGIEVGDEVDLGEVYPSIPDEWKHLKVAWRGLVELPASSSFHGAMPEGSAPPKRLPLIDSSSVTKNSAQSPHGDILIVAWNPVQMCPVRIAIRVRNVQDGAQSHRMLLAARSVLACQRSEARFDKLLFVSPRATPGEIPLLHHASSSMSPTSTQVKWQKDEEEYRLYYLLPESEECGPRAYVSDARGCVGDLILDHMCDFARET